MAKVLSKEKLTMDIVSMLEKGMERRQICEKLLKSAKVSRGTVDRGIKAAKVVISKRNEQREAIRLSVTTEEIQKAAKDAIISDLELEAILCTIATGKIKIQEIVQGVGVLRDVSPSEITKAIDLIFKKRGSNAPTKLAHTTKDGDDIPQYDLSKYTDDELRLIAEMQSKGRISQA